MTEKLAKDAALGDLVEHGTDWLGIVCESNPISFRVHWMKRRLGWEQIEHSIYVRNLPFDAHGVLLRVIA